MEKSALRFLSTEPRLAIALAQREKILLPKEFYEYIISWMEDVGTVMRSREFLVSSVSAYASNRILLSASKYSPLIERLIGLSR